MMKSKLLEVKRIEITKTVKIMNIDELVNEISILFSSSFYEKIKPKISYTLAMIFFGITLSTIFSNKLFGNNLIFYRDWNLASIIYIAIMMLIPMTLFLLNYWKPRIYFASVLTASFSIIIIFNSIKVH